MRTLFYSLSALSIALVGVAPAMAQSTAAPAAATKAALNTTDTDIGTLIDNPAAKAILDKYLPGFTANEQVAMARPMTLRGIQQYSSDTITDDKLAKIDADLAKLPAK